MSHTWRLIVEDDVAGAHAMALDRATLEGHARGEVPPTVRIFGWKRPTVSLGRFQDVTSVDLTACARRGFDVVRRPTGGRGVLHDDEVTYSVVAGVGEGVPRGVAASYRHLSAALVEAYAGLGVDAHLARGRSGSTSSAACYLQATQADLAVGALKLSGSAQVWQHDSVLQHGSFVVSRDLDAETDVFRLDGDGARTLAERAVTLSDLRPVVPTRAEIEAAVRSGFERALAVELAASSWTDIELERASSLRRDAVIAEVRA